MLITLRRALGLEGRASGLKRGPHRPATPTLTSSMQVTPIRLQRSRLHAASLGVLSCVRQVHLLLGNVELAHVPDHDRGRIAPQVAQLPQGPQK